jgi:hypothetical protein
MTASTFKRLARGVALAFVGVGIPLATAQADCGCGWEDPSLPGRMTGGGSIFMPDGQRVTHGFQLRCDYTDPRQNLEINWGGNKFHMTRLQSVECTDDPDIDPGKPFAVFDTLTAVVYGRCNKVENVMAILTFQDAGEPGAFDYGEIRMWGCPTGDFLTYGLLNNGNHQAHME